MKSIDYLKGAAAATAAAVAGKRPKQRAEVIERVVVKVRSQGIGVDALTQAVEASEKNAARRRK